MSVARERRHKFFEHDRITISGAHYRPVRKERGIHVLQLVVDNVIENHFITRSDAEINEGIRRKILRVDEAYYSEALALLRTRQDNSDLTGLSEEELRTVVWKREWCVRANLRRADPAPERRLKLTEEDLERFIDGEMRLMDRWYLNRFGERRPPGRQRAGEELKEFDYPSPSTLRAWLSQFRKGHERAEAFIPRYKNCGNRAQLHPEVDRALTQCVEGYKSLNRPTISDIYEKVESEMRKLRMRLGPVANVSERTVRRRIHLIEPFIADFSRLGEDRAIRKYLPVGKGNDAYAPMQRVEMDDWEIDLHSLVSKTKTWARLTPAEKAKVPRTRATITIGIDCATRCIVAFNITPNAPSTAAAKSAARTIFLDKQSLATFAGAKSPWDTYGRLEYLATDGGPVFRADEFEAAVAQVRGDRHLPDQDPRMRGTIESFFRTFKRLCRFFAGQSFANVVESGDYPSEQWASVTFEGLTKAAIRYIVDLYHQKEHRGLEGGTPYARWLALSTEGLAPAPSSLQLRAAFGFKDFRKTSKHGILHLNISYQSVELAQLHGLVQDPVEIRVDPDDMGAILVLIPIEHRGKILGTDGLPIESHFIEVPSENGNGKGRTLVDVLKANEGVRALARKEQQEGSTFRLDAYDDLFEEGLKAIQAAGIPSHELSQKHYELCMKHFKQKERAALGGREYGTEDVASDEEEQIGEVVGKSKPTTNLSAKLSEEVAEKKRRRQATPERPTQHPILDGQSEPPTPKKPFGGSTNLFGDDD